MGKCIHESDEESIREVGQRVSKCKLEISKVIFCGSVISSRKLWLKGETAPVQTETVHVSVVLVPWVSAIF